MNYHVVNQTHSSKRQEGTHHDWHFQATLLGAAVFFMLMVPLTNAIKTQNSNVLGSSTHISEKVYDSKYGYYEPVRQENDQGRDVFTRFVDALMTVFE